MNDKINAEINYLKLWIGVFIITFIALIGYLSANFNIISKGKFALSMLILVILFKAIYKIHNSIHSHIGKLKE